MSEFAALRLLKRGFISSHEVASSLLPKSQAAKRTYWAIFAALPEYEPWPLPVAWGFARSAAEARRHALLFMPAEAVLQSIPEDMSRRWAEALRADYRVTTPTPKPDCDDFDTWEAFWSALSVWSDSYYVEWSNVLDREEARWAGDVDVHRRYRLRSGGQAVRGQQWVAVLGLDPDGEITEAAILRAFKRAARKAHPDRGGTHEDFIRLTKARDEALKRVGAAA